jgi:hypothetical protein
MQRQSPPPNTSQLNAARSKSPAAAWCRTAIVRGLLVGLTLAACTRPTFAVRGTGDTVPEGEEATGPLSPDAEDVGLRGSTDAVSPAQAGGAGLGARAGNAALDAGGVSLPSSSAADASVAIDSTDSEDGGAPAAWSRGLEGSYARQIISYGFGSDGGLVRSATVLALSRIGQEGAAGLTMATEACRIDYEWPAAPTVIVDTGTPRPGAVTMRQAIRLGAEPQFALERAVLRFGFDVARGAGCSPGAYRARYPDQVWLYALPCRCPLQPQTLPSTADDCRLTDTDRDLAAAFTLVERSGSGITARYALALELAFQGGLGTLAPDGVPQLTEHSASAMGCVNAGYDGCGGAPPVSCEVTRTDFARLDGDAPTCADVLATGLSRLAKPPVPPDSCTGAKP